MANSVVETKNGKGWLLEKMIAFLQVVILIVVGVVYADLREVRDNSITFGTKQERLIRDVQSVEYNVRVLNNTVQQLVGQGKISNRREL